MLLGILERVLRARHGGDTTSYILESWVSRWSPGHVFYGCAACVGDHVVLSRFSLKFRLHWLLGLGTPVPRCYHSVELPAVGDCDIITTLGLDAALARLLARWNWRLRLRWPWPPVFDASPIWISVLTAGKRRSWQYTGFEDEDHPVLEFARECDQRFRDIDPSFTL